MERSKDLDRVNGSPPSPAPPADPPPAEAPIAHYWQVFARMVVQPSRVAPTVCRHAFYAGARAAFASVMDALTEIEADDPNGDVRLAAIEREVEGYFRDMAGRALISPTGKVDR